MKKRTLLIAITLFTIFTYAQTSDSDIIEKLNINTSKSEIKWSGEYAFYFGGHDGTIDFKDGYFLKQNEVITGGVFTIDMNSIKNTDITDAEGNAGLVEHLKNEDFFDVTKFPEAKLVITSVFYETDTKLVIHANLSIKNITKSINMRADVNYEKMQMTTKFKIDRTLWGINFNSKEVEGKLKDGLISDAIGFDVKLRL